MNRHSMIKLFKTPQKSVNINASKLFNRTPNGSVGKPRIFKKQVTHANLDRISHLYAVYYNAARKYKISKVAIGGGVGANLSLRTAFKTLGKVNGCKVFLPSRELCTDNAAMLACAAYYKIKYSKNKFIDGKIEPSMPLRNW